MQISCIYGQGLGPDARLLSEVPALKDPATRCNYFASSTAYFSHRRRPRQLLFLQLSLAPEMSSGINTCRPRPAWDGFGQTAWGKGACRRKAWDPTHTRGPPRRVKPAVDLSARTHSPAHL